jgi:hypothetical protein
VLVLGAEGGRPAQQLVIGRGVRQAAIGKAFARISRRHVEVRLEAPGDGGDAAAAQAEKQRHAPPRRGGGGGGGGVSGGQLVWLKAGGSACPWWPGVVVTPRTQEGGLAAGGHACTLHTCGSRGVLGGGPF